VKIDNEHPLLEPIARETYGILIYQEQVMQAARRLRATRPAARICSGARWAEKKSRKCQKQRETFVKGCTRKTRFRRRGECQFSICWKNSRLRLQ